MYQWRIGTAFSLIFGLASVAMAGLDTDTDGIPDSTDNCSLLENADQRDTDGDGFGNVCDPDLNNDAFVDFFDVGIFKSVFLSTDADSDFDGNGLVDFLDLGVVKAFFLSPPGPGATGPTITYTADVQPVFAEKCAPCHTVVGSGDHNIGAVYADAFLMADDFDECAGLNIAECSLVLIQIGEMPRGAGCTGNPAQDAGNASCLTQAEQDTVQAWIDAGLPE